MEQWEAPDAGVTRISNPKTLQRWIDLGLYQNEIESGYIFNTGCGRFRIEKCICSKCIKNTDITLDLILKNNIDKL